MYKTRYFALCVALIAALVATAAVAARAADDPAAAKDKEGALIEVLESDSPAAEKAITCKKLAIYGSKDAVPALKPLVANPQLASWARIALEAIPGPEADAALRDAAGTLEGRLAIGAINSVGVRRDAKAVDVLSKRLKDKDAAVASAAAAALGKIGNAPATKILQGSLAGAPEGVRSAVAEGCILCAERLMADDKGPEAAKLYDEVRKAAVPKQRVLEATRGAILARKAEGIPLLVELLRSDDKKFFQIGLSTARELAGSEVADALAGELVKANPARGALLLRALADRGDTVASPAVLQAAKSGPKPVRIAAIGVLRRLGTVSCVKVLLEIAAEDDEELARTATAAIAELPGKDVDAEIAARLAKAEGKMLPVLIELVGQRRIDAAPALLGAVDNPDAKIRAAALTALGETVGFDNLSVLISRVVTPKKPEEVEVAQKALRAACVRMPDGDACAAKLAAAMSKAPVATQCVILEILAEMGGAKALATVGAAAKGSDAELQDAGSRLLGGWMTVDAGPVLLELAKSDNKYKIRALRGYIRLARQFNMTNTERAKMCLEALKVAKRTDEQKLVLQVLERYPSVDTLKLAAEAAKVPALKADATRISIVIAQKLGGKSADVQKLLKQIGQNPLKIEIVKAQYGAGNTQKDVTEIIRRHVIGLPLIRLPSAKYNEAFGGDPVPGTVKQLKVQYRMNGKAAEATFGEDAPIMLPVPK